MFFHFTLSKSFSNGAQYVILHNKNLFDDKKSPKYDGFDQENSCTTRKSQNMMISIKKIVAQQELFDDEKSQNMTV